MAATSGPRILLYDIETSLQPVTVFQLQHNDWIDPSSILVERHLVSICWKWLGEKQVHSVSLLDDPKRFAKDNHDDRHVAAAFHAVMQEADVLVAHNGDHFDLRYLKTRMLFHKLPVLPPIMSIDTYKVAKQQFLFNSNKLDYLGKLLGVGGKTETPKGLWMDVFKGDRKAIKTMVDYNKRDVLLLEEVFKKLQPYIAEHVNRQMFGAQDGCPRCGSKQVQSRGVHRSLTQSYKRFQCTACGGWFRNRISEKTKPPTKPL